MGANGSKIRERHENQDMFTRMKPSKSGIIDFKPTVLDLRKLDYTKIHNAGFFGEWSRYEVQLGAPNPRISHFTAFDEENKIIYIGYGSGSDGKFINDVWALKTKEMKWSRVPIKLPKNSKICQRTNASACVLDGKLYVYGGFTVPNYSSDLQMIDAATGKVTLLETNGDKPIPMSMTILAGYDNKLIMWGGFDRVYHTDLYVLSLDTMTWTKRKTNIRRRTTVPYTIYKKDLYSFGGADNNSLLHIDLEAETLEEIAVNGAAPPSDVQCAELTQSDDYLFWLGGRSAYEFDYLFMMRKETKKWSILHLRPDNDTVFVDDGKLDALNLFAMPHFESFSFQYIEEHRALVSVLGKPFKDTSCINVFRIADAMSFVHMRDDMCDVLKVSITNP